MHTHLSTQSSIVLTSIINPRRACAARVTVVVLCVCVCVCVSVCLSVCYHSSGGTVHFYVKVKVRTAFFQAFLGFQLTDFYKITSFKSYGVIYLAKASRLTAISPVPSFFRICRRLSLLNLFKRLTTY